MIKTIRVFLFGCMIALPAVSLAEDSFAIQTNVDSVELQRRSVYFNVNNDYVSFEKTQKTQGRLIYNAESKICITLLASKTVDCEIEERENSPNFVFVSWKKQKTDLLLAIAEQNSMLDDARDLIVTASKNSDFEIVSAFLNNQSDKLALNNINYLGFLEDSGEYRLELTYEEAIPVGYATLPQRAQVRLKEQLRASL